MGVTTSDVPNSILCAQVTLKRRETQQDRRSQKESIALSEKSPEQEAEVEATLAYIQYTTEMEMAETANASFWECFQGTNLCRTEIVSVDAYLWTFLTMLPTHLPTYLVH